MDETRPISRIEHFLAVITGEDAELPTPQTRVELFLAVIAGGTYLLPEPQSRWELYLARILGQDVELPVPVSRDDRYLAAIAGMEGAEAPAFPISRVEMYLAEWAAQSGAQYETVTGAIVSFETVRAAALRRLEVALSPIQSGTGDPSPDNVRSISGHTAVNVWRTGKNLLNDVNPDVKNAYITGSQKLGSSPDNRTVIVPIKQNTNYTYTWNRVKIEGAAGDDTNILLFSEYPGIGTTIGTSTGSNMATVPSTRTFNSGDNIYAAIKIANITKTEYQATLSASQLEIGSPATSYEAYSGLTIPITIPTPPGTVYGGTLDVVSGVLTVTWASITIDGASGNAGNRANYKFPNKSVFAFRFGTSPGAFVPTANNNAVTSAICDRFKAMSDNVAYEGTKDGFSVSTTGVVSKLSCPSIAPGDIAGMNAWLAENPITIVGELAEPQIVQLTPQEVLALQGQNVVFSDANGDVTVEYRSN